MKSFLIVFRQREKKCMNYENSYWYPLKIITELESNIQNLDEKLNSKIWNDFYKILQNFRIDKLKNCIQNVRGNDNLLKHKPEKSRMTKEETGVCCLRDK